MRKPIPQKKFLIPAIALAAAAVIFLVYFLCTNTWIAGTRYSRSQTELDLRGVPLKGIQEFEAFPELTRLDLRDTGLTPEAHDALALQRPDCAIVWSVPFQGGYVDSNVASLTITALSAEDIPLFSRFPDLVSVEAAGCQDWDALWQLRQQYPDLDLHYQVELGGVPREWDVETLTLQDPQSGELMERLSYLPNLKTLRLEGQLPPAEELRALAEAYSAMDIRWELTLGGQTVNNTLQELSYEGVTLTAEEAEALLGYGTGLRKLVLIGTGLDTSVLGPLQDRYPDTQLVWDITIGETTFRTDDKEIDLSEIPMADTALVESFLPYLRGTEKVIMCNCGLSNEVMDDLRTRYEDTVKIVWAVNIGPWGQLRTDSLYFMAYQLGAFVTSEDLTELRYCKDIVCVDVGHKGVADCEFAAHLPNLKYLILADTPVSSIEPLRGLENLVFLEIFLTNVTDYSPLLDCPNLEDLNICYTSGDKAPLLEMKWLKRLWWGNSRNTENLPWSWYTELTEALPDTQVVFCPNSTGNNWRIHQNYYDMRDILGMPYFAF